MATFAATAIRRTLLSGAASVLYSIIATGQSAVFNNCTDLQTELYVANDVVRIDCDTAYVLNLLTFRTYDGAYRDLRGGNTAPSNLIAAYEEIVALQEHRLKSQQEAYNELRQKFAELSSASQSTLDESARRLATAAASMETATSDLSQTRRLLAEAQEIVESERRGLNFEKILWGAGGLAAGIVLGVLISK